MEAILIGCKGLSECAEGLLIGYMRLSECQAWLLIDYKRLKARKAWLLTDSERVAKRSATLSYRKCLVLGVLGGRLFALTVIITARRLGFGRRLRLRRGFGRGSRLGFRLGRVATVLAAADVVLLGAVFDGEKDVDELSQRSRR